MKKKKATNNNSPAYEAANNEPGPLQCRADSYGALDPDTIERFESDLTVRTYRVDAKTLDEKNRSIEAVIATENRVLVFDISRWEIVEEILLMSGCRMPESGQIPLLDTHDRSTVHKQFGSTRDFRIEGDKLIGRSYFSSSSVVDHSWTLTREGHLTDHSIGYKVHNAVTIEADKTVEVAGRNFTASPTRKLRVAIDWEHREDSVCPIGADIDAKNREQANIVSQGKDRPMNFENWLTERGLALADLDDAKRAELQAEYDAERTASEGASKAQGNKAASKKKKDKATTAQRSATAVATVQPPLAAVDAKRIADEAVAAERQRTFDIQTLGGDDVDGDVIQRCIDDGSTVDVARVAVLEVVRKSRPAVNAGPGIHVHSGEIQREVLENAMLLRAGYDDVVLAGGEEGAKRAEMAYEHRDMSLVDVCRYALQMDGGSVPAGREEMMRAAFSTASLPILLGNVAHKSLLKGYTMLGETWRKWCSIGSVSDFKTHTRARLTDTGDLEEVGNSGEVKHGGAEEEYEQLSIATYAKQFAITRQNLINDDLNAFTRTPMRMGRRASLKVSQLVYLHLLANGNMQDGVALFHADHGNLKTSAALNSVNLGKAKLAFRKQTDKDGQPINVEPKYLVIPPDLEQTALELLHSETLIATGDTDTKVPSKNVHKGTLELVIDPRLSNTNYSGYSLTTWFLAGRSAEVDTLEVSYLNGKQTPTIERFNPGADVLGVQFRVFLDAGVKALDFRGMVKNTA